MRITDQYMFVQQVLCTHTFTVHVLFAANKNVGSGCVCTASTMYLVHPLVLYMDYSQPMGMKDQYSAVQILFENSTWPMIVVRSAAEY